MPDAPEDDFSSAGTMMAAQPHFLHVYPGAFPPDAIIRAPVTTTRISDHSDFQSLKEQVELQAREIQRLQGTAAHYRAWAAQLQARYQMFSPDAARPAKRVYIGNLPGDMNDNELRGAVNDLMLRIGATAGDGPCVISCKLYPGAVRGGTSAGTVGSSRSESPERGPTGSSGPGSPRPLPPGGVSPLPRALPAGGPALTEPPSPGGFPLPQDKSYAFVEFRSVEEASNAMALDGVRFHDAYLKVRRPNNYDPAVAIMLGPVDPSPALDLSGLEVVRTVVADSPHKVFIGGLPCDWTEDQVTEMLLPFGPLRSFNLVMDRSTGNSRGYAFCEFVDVSVTDAVIQALHGKPVGNKYLTVKRALGPAPF